MGIAIVIGTSVVFAILAIGGILLAVLDRQAKNTVQIIAEMKETQLKTLTAFGYEQPGEVPRETLEPIEPEIGGPAPQPTHRMTQEEFEVWANNQERQFRGKSN